MGKPDSIKVDVVIGADGANSRVAKEIDAGMRLLALLCEIPPAATLPSQSCAAAELAISEPSREHSAARYVICISLE